MKNKKSKRKKKIQKITNKKCKEMEMVRGVKFNF